MNYYKELLETKKKVIIELTALKNTKIEGLTLTVGHEEFELLVTPIKINGSDLHIQTDLDSDQDDIWVVDRLSAEELFEIHNHIFNVSGNAIKYFTVVGNAGIVEKFEI